jgi:hypothetical protein
LSPQHQETCTKRKHPFQFARRNPKNNDVKPAAHLCRHRDQENKAECRCLIVSMQCKSPSPPATTPAIPTTSDCKVKAPHKKDATTLALSSSLRPFVLKEAKFNVHHEFILLVVFEHLERYLSLPNYRDSEASYITIQHNHFTKIAKTSFFEKLISPSILLI